MRPVRQVYPQTVLTFPPGDRAPGDRDRAGRVSPDDLDASIIHQIDSDKAQPSGPSEMVARNTVGCSLVFFTTSSCSTDCTMTSPCGKASVTWGRRAGTLTMLLWMWMPCWLR